MFENDISKDADGGHNYLFDEPEKISFENITGEHKYVNYRILTLINYVFFLVGLVLQVLFLASDVYTLVQIYYLDTWDDFHAVVYIPVLAYKIIFTTCIGISFIYVIFVCLSTIIIHNKHRVVSTYLNSGARNFDSFISYNRFCIFEEIETSSFHDWFCLKIFTTYHYVIISWLLADTPRQLLNGTTIGYIISDKFTNGNITQIISQIANDNKKEAVLLSLMTFSFIVWLYFTFINIVIILSSICIIKSVRKNNGIGFNRYCADLVAAAVSKLYEKKVQEQEVEFSKQRKLPTDDSVEMDDIITTYDYPESISSDVSNHEKSTDPNPFSITKIPTSHSRANLLNNFNDSQIALHNNGFNDSVYDFSRNESTNSTNALNEVNPFSYNNKSNNNNKSYDLYQKQNIFDENNNILGSRNDGEQYIPSDVYDENYHRRTLLLNNDPNIYSQNTYPDNSAYHHNLLYKNPNMASAYDRSISKLKNDTQISEYIIPDLTDNEFTEEDNKKNDIEEIFNVIENDEDEEYTDGGIDINAQLENTGGGEIIDENSKPSNKRASKVLYGSRTIL